MKVPRAVVLGCLIALAGIIFYWPVLTKSSAFYLVDIGEFFEPMTKYCVDRILVDHQFPLWNPYVYCGMPQIAVQSPSIWYLPNVVFLLASFSQALAIILILHQTAAAIGSYLLFRELGMKPCTATFAGVLAAFNGYMFSIDTNWTLMAGCAWLPWLLYTVRKTATTSSVTFPILLSIFWYLFLTTGRPEVVLPGTIVFAVFVFFATGSRLKEIAIALASGTLLAMPMILPALEWLPLSRRSGGLDPRETQMLAANWYDFTKLILFPWLGDQRLEQNMTISWVARSGSLFLASSFVGPITIVLAVGGFLTREKWKSRLHILALLFIGIVLCTGTVPIPLLLRFPIKMIWLVIFAIIVAAAQGIERVPTKWLPCTLIALTSIMLIWNGCLCARHWASGQFYELPSISAQVIADSKIDLHRHRVTGLFHHQNFAVPPKLRSGTTANQNAIISATYDRQSLNPNSNMDFKIPSAWGFEGASTGQYYKAFSLALSMSSQSTGLFPDSPNLPKTDDNLAALMREAAVGMVISQSIQLGDNGFIPVRDLDPNFFRLLQRDRAGNLTYYEVIDAPARISFPGATIQVMLDEPEKIVVKTKRAEEGVLCIQDQYYPGWQATVDGARTRIIRKGDFFRGIIVPAGEHTVELAYEPLSWKIGLVCAALGVIAITALFLRARARWPSNIRTD